MNKRVVRNLGYNKDTRIGLIGRIGRIGRIGLIGRIRTIRNKKGASHEADTTPFAGYSP